MSRLGEYFSFRHKPRGVWKWLLELPIWVYRARLGFLFGDRLVVIVHRGRTSGNRYETALEVAHHYSEQDEYVVTSGTGPDADWYRNVTASPAEELWIGNGRFRPSQRSLSTTEAVAVMQAYQLAHPQVAGRLEQMMGVSHDGTPESWTAMMDRLPMMAFKPVEPL